MDNRIGYKVIRLNTNRRPYLIAAAVLLVVIGLVYQNGGVSISWPKSPAPTVVGDLDIRYNKLAPSRIRITDGSSDRPKTPYDEPTAVLVASDEAPSGDDSPMEYGGPAPMMTYKSGTGEKTAYIHKYHKVAVDGMAKYGVPASIKLAQAILESDAGRSWLARTSNNHFGIKCRKKCRGCTCRNFTDDSVYDMFRVFDDAEDSYDAHYSLLASGKSRVTAGYGWIVSKFKPSRDKIKFMFKQYLRWDENSSKWVSGYRRTYFRGKEMVDGLTYELEYYEWWAIYLRNLGYATDDKYPDKLVKLIKDYGLTKYDKIH